MLTERIYAGRVDALGQESTEVIDYSLARGKEDYDMEPAGAYGLIHNYSNSGQALYICMVDTWHPACNPSYITKKGGKVAPGKTDQVEVALFQYDYFCYGSYLTKVNGKFEWIRCPKCHDMWHFHWSNTPIEDSVVGEDGVADDWEVGDICALTYLDGQFIVWNTSGETINYEINAKGKINGVDVEGRLSFNTKKSMFIGLIVAFEAKKYGIEYLWSIDGQVRLISHDRKKSKVLYVKGGIVRCKKVSFESNPTDAKISVD